MKLSFCLLLGCLLASVVNAKELPADQPIPTHADISYGPHERHVLDFFKADSDKPTPVLVFIHGGGWLHGNKEKEAHIYCVSDVSGPIKLGHVEINEHDPYWVCVERQGSQNDHSCVVVVVAVRRDGDFRPGVSVQLCKVWCDQ